MPNTPQVAQQLQGSAAMELPRAHQVEPFGQFQGFSSLSTRHEHMLPRFSVYGYQIPEGDISPRMAILNPVSWESPRPRVQTLAGNVDENLLQSQSFQSCCGPDSDGNGNAIPGQHEAALHQWPLSHHCNVIYPPTPPYLHLNDLVQQTYHAQGGRHVETTPPPMPYIASRQPNTFRVPSDSEPGNLSGISYLPPSDTLAGVSEAGDEAVPIPSPTLDNGNGDCASTIYPEDSVSIASPAGASPKTRQQKTLADVVIEIHDICLAATQRYLGNLQVNWDLRNGRPVGWAGIYLVESEPVRGHDRVRGDRWAPYGGAGSRRRARSESHLKHMACQSSHRPQQHHQHQDQRGALVTKTNPIPSPTSSLLHNVRHICDLIWRRAQRDREDVLGADAWGCREMSFLHDCGEAIVLYNAVDAERDPTGCLHRVLAAGKGLCRQLEDWEGIRLIGDGGEPVEDV